VAEDFPTSTETIAEPRSDTPIKPGADTPARSRPSASVLVAAGLGVALVIGAAVTGIVLNSAEQTSDQNTAAGASTGPVLLVPVEAPQASSTGCASLVKNLPEALPNAGGKLNRRPLATPVQPGTAAWGPGDSPVVLRCGVEQPPEFTATSELLGVSGVQWLQITGDDGAATWYAVDRAACIALTLPSGLGTGPIQEVSATISGTMAPVAIHPTGG
jgi:hypothetical protein